MSSLAQDDFVGFFIAAQLDGVVSFNSRGIFNVVLLEKHTVTVRRTS